MIYAAVYSDWSYYYAFCRKTSLNLTRSSHQGRPDCTLAEDFYRHYITLAFVEYIILLEKHWALTRTTRLVAGEFSENSMPTNRISFLHAHYHRRGTPLDPRWALITYSVN